MFDTSEIVAKANRIVEECSTRDPHKIARELGIEVMPCAFQKQKGAYKVILRNRFIFIKDDLHPVMEKIVSTTASSSDRFLTIAGMLFKPASSAA